MKKFTRSAILLTLAIAIIISSVPLSFAEVEDTLKLTGNASDVICEVVERREDYSRHYLTGDGSYIAVSYSDQVSYLDSDGVRREANYSFSSNLLTGEKVAGNDLFNVKFSNKAKSSKLVKVTNGDDSISWGITVSENGEKYNSLNNVKGDTIEYENDIRTTDDIVSSGNAVSKIVYKNAYGDMLDLSYTVSHKSLKEDLVIKEKGRFDSYKVTYNTNKGETAFLQNDGRVFFYNADGEIFFITATPLMYDSAHNVSYDIDVKLVIASKSIEVIYTPSSEWMNSKDRVYPITIDPEIESNRSTQNIMDTYVYLGEDACGLYNDSPTLCVNWDCETYIKILNPPSIPESLNVSGLELIVHADTNEGTPALDEVQEWHENTLSTSERPVGWQLNYAGPTVYQIEDAVPNVYKLVYNLRELIWEPGVTYQNYISSFDGVRLHFNDPRMILLFSSENTNVGYRPYLVVRYGGSSSPDIASGSLYRIKNANSEKHITFTDADGLVSANVYQSNYELEETEQVFIVSYSAVRGSYTFKAYHYPGVTTGKYLKQAETSNGFNNIILGDGHTTNVACEWTLNEVDDDTYVIHSMYDPESVIKSLGTSNGTANGSSSSSGGNIIMSEYVEGDASQYWIFERCANVYPANGSITDIYQQSDTHLYLLGSEFSDWTSDESNYVSVLSKGLIELKKEGVVKLTSVSTATNESLEIEIHVTFKNDTVCNINNAGYDDLYAQTDSTSENEVLELHAKNEGANQLWRLEHIELDYYRIISIVSGKALMIPSGKQNVDNTKVVQGSVDNNNYNQQWQIQKSYNDNYQYYTITNRGSIYANSNLVMTAVDGILFSNSTARICAPTTDDQYDSWNITNYSGDSLGVSNIDVYRISLDTKYLEIYDENDSAESSVWRPTVYDYEFFEQSYSNGAYWRLVAVGNGFYKMYSMNTCKVMGSEEKLVLSYSTNGGVYASVESPYANDEQLWKIMEIDDYYAFSPKTNPYMYLQESSSGALPSVTYYTDAAKWSLEKLEYSSDNFTGDTLKGISFSSPGNKIKYYISNIPDGHPYTENMIHQAISEWNHAFEQLAVGQTPVIEFEYDTGIPDTDGDYYVVFAPTTSLSQYGFAYTERNFNEAILTHCEIVIYTQYANTEKNIIYNASAISEEVLIGILIHEIGHVLCLEHTVAELYSVMQQGIFDNEYLKNYITYFDLVKIHQRFSDG